MEYSIAEPISWPLYQKVAFRYFLILFTLYIFFNPNGVLPYSEKVYEIYIQVFHQLITWASTHVLHMAKPVTTYTGGSGDTTYDYLIVLLSAIAALIGCLVWSVLDRHRRNYNKLLYWFTVVIRYYVAITMICYGSVKVIKLQFPSPSLSRLLQPYGNSSPMGLAWTYMGYSTGFNYFTGFAEVFCGLLLFFRKTSVLGAVMGLVVAGNIMAINYCFDVPVKLLATALVLMCLFILLRDSQRLIKFFFLNQPAPPSNLSPHRFKANWKNITLTTIKYLIIVYTIAFNFYAAWGYAEQGGFRAKKPPLYGIYEVTTFIRNKYTIQPLITDTSRWRRLIIQYEGRAQVNMMNDSSRRYTFKTDTSNKSIIMFATTDTLNKAAFTYTVPKPGELLITGKWKKDSLLISMRRFDPANFPLMKRGFHWINETPYNR